MRKAEPSLPALGMWRGCRAALRLCLCGTVAWAAAGCAGPFASGWGPPSREGSISPAVRYAYFSTSLPVSAHTIQDSDMPPSYTEFDPDKQDKVIFIVAVNTLSFSGDISIRGELRGPDGMVRERFRSTRRAGSRHSWTYTAREFATSTLRSSPGQWTMDLYVADGIAGRYRFLLGDQAALQRLKRPGPSTASAPPAAVASPAPAEPVGNRDVPLPSDVRVVPVAADVPRWLAALSGRWEGTWEGVRGGPPVPHVLVVEEVSASQVATVYAFGRAPELSIEPGHVRATGTVTRERTFRIELREGETEAEYTLSDDLAVLEGTWRLRGERRATIVMRKMASGEQMAATPTPPSGAPPSPAPARGRLELRGPGGALVSVNRGEHPAVLLDENSGKAILQLPPGTYLIEVYKRGFHPWSKRVTLDLQRDVTEQVSLAPVASPPPAVTVHEPGPGARTDRDTVRVRAEIRSPHRITALRIQGAPGAARVELSPDPGARTGEPWVVEAEVKLAPGDNTLVLEAEDEHGSKAARTVTVSRQIAIAAPPPRQAPAPPAPVSPPAPSLVVPLPAPPPVVSLPAAPLASPPRDEEAPRIAINYPPLDSKLDREQIVVLGLVTDNAEIAQVHVTVNGVEISQPRPTGATRRAYAVRVPITLQPGENVIEVTATDKEGNASQAIRSVTRLAPALVAPVAPRIPNRWAVVIGVGEYEHPGIPRLRYAARDAEAIYRFLTTEGGFSKDQVLLLTDSTPDKPTLHNIRRALGDFLYRRPGREDMVLIYFAGHGAPEVDGTGTEGDGLSKYLIPRNADPDSLYTTAFPMDEILRVFVRIPAERVVVLLDTCYSGSAGGRTFARQQVRAGGLSDQFLDRLTRSKGRVIITASSPNEVALEISNLGHGLFTYYVLEGLRGKADRDGDGIVTVSELYEYVESAVERKAREVGGRQRPVMKGEMEGSLPLVRIGR